MHGVATRGSVSEGQKFILFVLRLIWNRVSQGRRIDFRCEICFDVMRGTLHLGLELELGRENKREEKRGEERKEDVSRVNSHRQKAVDNCDPFTSIHILPTMNHPSIAHVPACGPFHFHLAHESNGGYGTIISILIGPKGCMWKRCEESGSLEHYLLWGGGWEG